ncbi:MAG TPA: PIN domain-containing protein [Pyrinomonadaceae bacterium]|nr:PIN domain-containing protein [Pyrinomonadaceae bacterium]
MLIDTSGFFSIHDRAEKQHHRAQELYQNSQSRLTTSYILAEYVALALVRGLARKRVVAFSEEVLHDESVEIVWVNEDLHRNGLDLLRQRPDKTYSLCDAVSFVLMRERGETEALTTDRHFEQEGLVRLLVP